mmetsp:Transcript_4461/g.17552  ORF Transcript_4461/g.17552 Transcript_4461/m.17552 type:complete len:219 (+) Transcript_4461:406-1062(+)
MRSTQLSGSFLSASTSSTSGCRSKSRQIRENESNSHCGSSSTFLRSSGGPCSWKKTRAIWCSRRSMSFIFSRRTSESSPALKTPCSSAMSSTLLSSPASRSSRRMDMIFVPWLSSDRASAVFSQLTGRRWSTKGTCIPDAGSVVLSVMASSLTRVLRVGKIPSSANFPSASTLRDDSGWKTNDVADVGSVYLTTLPRSSCENLASIFSDTRVQKSMSF